MLLCFDWIYLHLWWSVNVYWDQTDFSFIMFQELFKQHQVQHPVIIINGMKFADVKLVIEFMYRGEIKVWSCLSSLCEYVYRCASLNTGDTLWEMRR